MNEAITAGPASWVRWRIVALLMALSFVSWFNRENIVSAYTERIQASSGITTEDIGWVYSALLIVYTVCMTPGGWFADPFGTRLSLAIVGVGLGIFAVLTGVTGWIFSAAMPLLISLFLIRSTMGAFAAPMYPAGSHAVAHWIPWPQRAGANGFVQGAAALGIAMTPILFGRL